MELISHGYKNNLLSIVNSSQKLQKTGITLYIVLTDKDYHRVGAPHISQHRDDPLIIYFIKSLIRIDPQAILLLKGHDRSFKDLFPIITCVADKNIRLLLGTFGDIQVLFKVFRTFFFCLSFKPIVFYPSVFS